VILFCFPRRLDAVCFFQTLLAERFLRRMKSKVSTFFMTVTLQLAGHKKFKAAPTQTAQVLVTNGVLKMQLFPTGLRDAPAIKGIWVRKSD
jgi:hypothetical protein